MSMKDSALTWALLVASTAAILVGYLIGIGMLIGGQLEIEHGQSVTTSDGIEGIHDVRDNDMISHGQRSSLWGSIILTCMTGLFFIPVILSIILIYEKIHE